MSEKKLEVPPLKEPYELTEGQKAIVDRFIEEIKHRTHADACAVFYKENCLTYPSVPDDQVVVELRIGNWHKRAIFLEREALDTHGQALFYFFRNLVDDLMCDLLVRGANTF